MSMLSEITEQPEVIGRLLEFGRPALPEIAEMAGGCTHVIVAARGTSDNAARYAQYLWGAHNRLPVGLTTPSLFGPLDSPPALDGALVVGISQSGQSPDLVAVLSEARRQGRPALVLTNEVDSPLAATADVVIDLCAGPERAIAATKSYTAQLAAVAMVSRALAGSEEPELEALPEHLETALSAPPPVVEELTDADRCAVVGRGFHLATAFEWALKLQELTYLLAQPFSSADFLHGPVAIVERGFPVLTVATTGPTYTEMAELAGAMTERGATVVTLTDEPGTPGVNTIGIPRVAPWLSPIVAAPVIQRFAHDLTVARGLDPEAPRGLSKVTRTR